MNINENKINKQYPAVNVLSPSIKFDPLITIKMQKVVNNKFNIFLSSKKSKKISLSELIFISKKNKKLAIAIDCKKNLFIGDSNKPKSDNTPKIKIKIKNTLNAKLFSFQKKIHETKIIKPPV